MRCAVCGRKSDTPGCFRCWTRGFHILGDLPTAYVALEDMLIPAKGYGEKVQGTRTPPIPARLDVLYLRTGGISKTLQKHEREIRISLYHSSITFQGDEQQTIVKSSQYLRNQWDWIQNHYLPDLLRDLNKLHGQIENALGNRSEEITIGTCPAEDEEGNPCGAILRINPKILESYGDIRCPHCATVWESTKWRLLGQIIEQTNVRVGADSVEDVQGVDQDHSALGA